MRATRSGWSKSRRPSAARPSTSGRRCAPRYVDSDRYNGCGECAEVCPKRFDSVFDAGLAEQLAAYRLYPQATPDSFVIEKRSVAPYCAACPAGQRAQGYISLIREGRVDDVYRSIIEDNPFPRHQLDWFPEQKDQAVGVAFDCPAADHENCPSSYKLEQVAA